MALRYVSRIYCGLAKPDGGSVALHQFDGFLSDTVAEAFPDGFTVTAAWGGWNGSEGFITEDSRVIEVYHSGSDTVRRKVRDVAVTYRQRFGQDAVMVSTQPLHEEVQFL